MNLEASAQTWTARFNIVNQPANKIILGSIQGDNFTPIDSVQALGAEFQFTFTAKNHAGVYRILLGQTPYARLMNEEVQQLDFIFNRENIHIETDFKTPGLSARVIHSEENKLWYEVLSAKSDFEKTFSILEKEVDHYWLTGDTAAAWDISNEFNRLQMAHDIYLGQKTQQFAHLLVSKFIAAYRRPVTDGYLTADERKQSFQQDFFKTLDFSHKELINSAVYTDKIFEYLVTYNNPSFTKIQREKAYIPAIEIIMPKINKDPDVYSFLKSYLIHGFELLQMQNVVEHIKAKYN